MCTCIKCVKLYKEKYSTLNLQHDIYFLDLTDGQIGMTVCPENLFLHNKTGQCISFSAGGLTLF